MADLLAKSGRGWDLDMIRASWFTKGAYLAPGGSEAHATWVLHAKRVPTDLVKDTEMHDIRKAIEVAEEYLP